MYKATSDQSLYFLHLFFLLDKMDLVLNTVLCVNKDMNPFRNVSEIVRTTAYKIKKVSVQCKKQDSTCVVNVLYVE